MISVKITIYIYMGRHCYNTKTELDELKKITIVFLKKYKYLDDGWHSGTINWSRNGEQIGSVGIQSLISDEENYLRITYTQTDRDTGDKKDFDYKNRLTTTPCSFGGKRYWFICGLSVNGNYCGKRVGVLYKAGDYFGCRNCQKLTYASRNENRRGQFAVLGKIMDLEDKAEKLYKNKRWQTHYKGVPTKRYVKYRNYYNASNIGASEWLKDYKQD
jgi:hypothetical protein